MAAKKRKSKKPQSKKKNQVQDNGNVIRNGIVSSAIGGVICYLITSGIEKGVAYFSKEEESINEEFSTDSLTFGKDFHTTPSDVSGHTYTRDSLIWDNELHPNSIEISTYNSFLIGAIIGLVIYVIIRMIKMLRESSTE